MKELEDLTAVGFRKPGQSYMEAKLEAQEILFRNTKMNFQLMEYVESFVVTV